MIGNRRQNANRSVLRGARCALGWFVLLLISGVPALAQQADEHAPIRYRRVFAPEDRIDGLVPDDVRYLPIPQAEFQQLVELAGLAESGPAATAAVDVIRSQYVAHHEQPGQIRGTAQLEVRHNTTGPALLPLVPCGVAMDNLRWKRDPQSRVQLGVGPDGICAVLVEKSDTLLFDWSLRALSENGLDEFRLALPESTTRQLRLTLSADVRPVVTGGLARAVETRDDRRTWRIDLAGTGSPTLRLSTAPSARGPRMPMLRQTSHYELTPRGMELATQFVLDADQQPLDNLQLRLDPALRIVRARVGDTDVAWSVADGAQGQHSLLTIALPDPTSGQSRTIRLAGIAPLVQDESWQLPRIVPEQVFWSEGTISLAVHDPLQLNALQVEEGRQRSVEPLPNEVDGQLYMVQQYGPETRIVTEVVHPRGKLELREGMTLDIGNEEITCQIVADFRANLDSRFSLTAEVSPGTIVDQVRSDPPGQVADWDIKNNRLRIYLKQALVGNRSLRMRFTCRTPRSKQRDRLSVEDFTPLEFVDVDQVRRLTLIRTNTPYQLRVSGEASSYLLAPDDLQPGDADLLAPRWEGLLFDTLPRPESLLVELVRNRVRFAASVEVDAEIRGDSLEESYTFRCAPEGGRIEQLRVHFSEARATPPTWILPGREQAQLTTERIAPVEGPNASRGETWLVTLRYPRSTPFELRATRVSQLETETPLSLAALPQSPQHEATLVVHGFSNSRFSLHNRRLDPIPPDEIQTNNGAIQATYRYDPARDAFATGVPAVTVAPAGKESQLPLAVVWNMQLSSRYSESGQVSHTLSLQIRNNGKQSVSVGWGKPNRLRAVWVDGQMLRRESIIRSELLCTVPLPAQRQLSTVVLHLESQGPPLGTLKRITAPALAVGVPVLNREWTVWSPAGFLPIGEAPRLSWSQRLFGPLGQMPNRPESQLDDAQIDANVRRAAGLARQMQSLLDASPELSWNEIFSRLINQEGAETAMRSVRIDWYAISQSAVNLDAAIAGGNLDSIRRGEINDPRLALADLALVAYHDGVIVTTLTKASLYPDQIVRTGMPSVHRVKPGPLASHLASAHRLPDSVDTISMTHWSSDVALPEPPWHDPIPISASGWSGYPVYGPLDDTTQVTIVHWDAVRTIGWGAFFVAFSLGVWRLKHRPYVALFLTVGLACTALLCSEAVAPIASGALLGMLLSLAWCYLFGRLETQSATRRTDLWLATGSTASLASLLLLVLASSVWGQDTADSTTAKTAAATIPKVFIPVDDKQQVVGEHYFLPESLYYRLRRTAARLKREPYGWSIEAAEYRGRITRDGADGRPAIEGLRAELDVVVFSPDAKLSIPWPADVEPPAEGCTLDGQPIAVTRQNGRLIVAVATPGRYHWAVPLTPEVVDLGTLSGIDWPIVAHPQAKLELMVPADAPRIDVPSAVGGPAPHAAAEKLTATLGPTNRLSVRWPTDDVEGGPAEFSVDQFDWLRIRPGAVTLHTRIALQPLKGSIRTVRIETDARLRLTRFQDNPLIADVQMTDGPVRTYDLKLEGRTDERLTIAASFALADAGGVGHYRLPSIRVTDATATRRAIAVSVDPTLTYEQTGAATLKALAVPTFVQNWGETTNKPLFAYEAVGGAAQWSIATRPVPVEVTATERASWSISQSGANVHYVARLNAGSQPRYAYQLQVPKELELEEMTVLADGTNRLGRVTKNSSGTVTILLNSAVTEKHTIELFGVLARGAGSRWAIPDIRLLDAKITAGQLDIFRQADVQVILPKDVESEVSDQADADQPDQWGRLVARFATSIAESRPEGEAAPARLAPQAVVVKPNKPQASGYLITRLERGADRWRIHVQCRLQVQDGVLDALWFDTPSWVEPENVKPVADVTWRDANNGQRHIRLLPRSATSGTFQIEFTALLPADSGRQVQVPDIRLIGVEGLVRYLVLPTQSELEQITWETVGLQTAALPDEALGTLASPATYEVYRVIDDEFNATPKPARFETRLAQVRLADVSLAWQSDGSSYGVASFDLDPAGLTRCQVILPPGSRLVEARVDGRAALVEPLRVDRFRLELGPRELPQRIELVYLFQVNADLGTLELKAPRLSDGRRMIDVERTLWTVYSPRAAGIGVPLEGAPTESVHQELLRLRSTASLLDLDSTATARLSSAQLARWYRPWAQRLHLLGAAVQRAVATDRDSQLGEDAQAEARTLLADHELIAQRLGMNSAWNDTLSGTRKIDDASEICNWGQGTGQHVTRMMFPGSMAALEMRYPQWRLSDTVDRWIAVLLLAGVTLGVVAVGRAGSLPDLLWNAPQVPGVLLGIAWCLWLTPWQIGLVIILLSLLAAVLAPWRLHSVSSVGSTIIGHDDLA